MRLSPHSIVNNGWGFLRRVACNSVCRTWGLAYRALPTMFDLKYTFRCNLKCVHCRTWTRDPTGEMGPEDWKSIFRDLRRSLGPCIVRFCGGEPFCRPDFPEMLRYCRQQGIATLLTTNATLIDEEAAKELQRQRVLLAQVSLDGINPATHDALRGVTGTYERVMEALGYLEGRIPVQLNTTIMGRNLDEMVPLARCAIKRGMRISFQGLVNFSAPGDQCFENDPSLFPDDHRKTAAVIDELCALKRSGGAIVNSIDQLRRLRSYYAREPLRRCAGCEASGEHVWIKQKGDVYVCQFKEPVGNLTRQRFKDVWRSPLFRRRIKEMDACEESYCLVIRGCYGENLREFFGKVRALCFARPGAQKRT